MASGTLALLRDERRFLADVKAAVMGLYKELERPRALRISQREFTALQKLLLALGNLSDVQLRLNPNAVCADPATPEETEVRLRAFMAWMHAHGALATPADAACGRGQPELVPGGDSEGGQAPAIVISKGPPKGAAAAAAGDGVADDGAANDAVDVPRPIISPATLSESEAALAYRLAPVGGGMGNGVVATRAVTRGAALLEVPLRVMLTTKTALQSPGLGALIRADRQVLQSNPSTALAMHLLCEDYKRLSVATSAAAADAGSCASDRGADDAGAEPQPSFYAPYIDTLPRGHSVPLCTATEAPAGDVVTPGIRELFLRGSPALRRVRRG